MHFGNNDCMYKIIGADQKEYGPITAEQMVEWISQGRANMTTLAKSEADAAWRPLSQFPEFAAALAAKNPPPALGYAPAAPYPGSIPNYLVQSILVTLCCCLPFGIVAIVYAAQVNSKFSTGDVAGAQNASAQAKKWCWISVIVGLITNAIVVVIQFAVAGANLAR